MTTQPSDDEALESELIAAIEGQRLVASIRELRTGAVPLEPELRARVDEAASALEQLGRDVLAEARDLHRALQGAGIDAEISGPVARELDHPSPMLQISSIDLTVSAHDSWTAYELLRSLGFTPWMRSTEAGWEIVRRTAGTTALVRPSPAGFTTQVQLRWEPGALARLPEALRPNARDFERIALPRRLWPLYFPIRVARLVADRVTKTATTESIGPFLGTPSSLIGPLLDLAEVGPDDVVLDLGCGDGRILVEAATRGSRGIGVELRADLVSTARARADEAGVADRIDFTTGDASSVDATTADVVFLFLPAEVTSSMVAHLLETARSGTRIVAHEQEPLSPATAGERHALITAGGVTVAHRWRVDR